MILPIFAFHWINDRCTLVVNPEDGWSYGGNYQTTRTIKNELMHQSSSIYRWHSHTVLLHSDQNCTSAVYLKTVGQELLLVGRMVQALNYTTFYSHWCSSLLFSWLHWRGKPCWKWFFHQPLTPVIYHCQELSKRQFSLSGRNITFFLYWNWVIYQNTITCFYVHTTHPFSHTVQRCSSVFPHCP